MDQAPKLLPSPDWPSSLAVIIEVEEAFRRFYSETMTLQENDDTRDDLVAGTTPVQLLDMAANALDGMISMGGGDIRGIGHYDIAKLRLTEDLRKILEPDQPLVFNFVPLSPSTGYHLTVFNDVLSREMTTFYGDRAARIAFTSKMDVALWRLLTDLITTMALAISSAGLEFRLSDYVLMNYQIDRFDELSHVSYYTYLMKLSL